MKETKAGFTVQDVVSDFASHLESYDKLCAALGVDHMDLDMDSTRAQAMAAELIGHMRTSLAECLPFAAAFQRDHQSGRTLGIVTRAEALLASSTLSPPAPHKGE